ncbi:MAG: F0F1 ATP synthase subunit delta [Candidatus Gracilibacteria bacterium]
MKISPRKYAQALAAVLGSSQNAPAAAKNFLELLRRRKQLKLLPKIVQLLDDELSAERGIVKLEISFPPKFKDSLNDFKKNLSASLGKQLEIQEKPQENLIGGFRIKMGDTLIDASMKGRLQAFARHLANI